MGSRNKIQWGKFSGERIVLLKMALRQLHIHMQNNKVEPLTQNGL